MRNNYRLPSSRRPKAAPNGRIGKLDRQCDRGPGSIILMAWKCSGLAPRLFLINVVCLLLMVGFWMIAPGPDLSWGGVIGCTSDPTGVSTYLIFNSLSGGSGWGPSDLVSGLGMSEGRD